MVGETILHYKIIEKIGEGGMGEVYKAEDTKLKRIVALKFLPPKAMRDKEAKERFIREAQATSALDHLNICTIHEIEETEDGRMFIAMAYYEGQSLKDKVNQGPLPYDESIDIALQVAKGLEKAHGVGILHRDIKPANVMMTSDGVAKIVYLVPCKGHFRVTFIFGDKAVAAAEQSTLPESILEMLRSARRYAEGRAIRFEVRKQEDVENVKKLIEIKMAN